MLIAIEGCLGVGKTTVATGLAALRNSTLLLENFEANPFLRAFYEDPAGNAIETEFAFLMLHFHQLKRAAGTIADGEIVSDFHLGKDVLYAEMNLQTPLLRRVFRDLYEVCSERLPAPDVVILLSASTDLVIDRIRHRNRSYECAVDPTYYDAVNVAYDVWFTQYQGRKLRIDMNDWDFVRSPELYDKLNSLLNAEVKLT